MNELILLISNEFLKEHNFHFLILTATRMHDVEIDLAMCETKLLKGLHKAFKCYLLDASRVLLANHFIYHSFCKIKCSFAPPHTLNSARILNRD